METQQNLEENQYDSSGQLATEPSRRKYPTHAKGGKSEWVGMIQHQAIINDELAKTEKGIKILKLKTMMNEYERQQLEHLERRQAELNQKKQDFEDMLRKNALFEQQKMQYKNDLNILKNSLNHQYSEDIQMKNQARHYFKSQEMETEKRILDENRRKMESEERRKRDKKERERQMAWEEIERNRLKKLELKNDGILQKTEVSEMQKKNALKEVTKEENYKNFYKLCAQNQNALINLHKSNVLDPRIEKERNLKEIIEKGVVEERIRQIQRENEKNSKRQEELQKVKNSNINMMSEHVYVKNFESEEKKKQNEQRMKELAAYEEYLKFKKQEKLQVANDYKNELEKQYEEKDNKINNQFRMTKNEKKLNYFDLQVAKSSAYKGMEPALYSMIPGWSPQVGVLKPFQKLDNKAAETLANNTEEAQNNNSPPKQPYFSPNSIITNLAGNINPNKYQPQFQSNLKANFEVKSPMGIQTNINAQLQNNIDKMGGNMVSPKVANVLLGDGGSLSNPYILKELQKNRTIFTKVGQESLVK